MSSASRYGNGIIYREMSGVSHMKNKNILFIVAEIDFVDNFGIALLSAVAKSVGWNTFFTIFSQRKIDKLFEGINPEIVCYSAMSANSDTFLGINRYLKSKDDFISVMGGPHPTFFPQVIQDKYLDFICIGEGELAFKDFLIKYKNGEDIENVKNFHSKKNKNPLRELISNLDDLPLPDRGLIYDAVPSLKNMPVKTFMSSRGCPYPCAYCFNQSLKEKYKGKGPYVRTHSVGRVVAEIADVRSKYPLEFIKFEDDFFGMDASWLEEFSKTYKKDIALPFNALLRLEAMTKDNIQLLKEAGCHSASFSIDSFNERIRNEIIHRNMKLSQNEIVSRLRMIKESGIKTYVNYILGIPTSTIDDEIKNIDLSIEAGVDYATSTILVPYPQTEMWYYVQDNKFLNVQTTNMFSSIQKRSVLNCFTEKEKDIQWNLSCFYPIMVKLPFFKNMFIWTAKHSKPNLFFSLIFAVSKSYLMGHQILNVKINLSNIARFVLKALKIEMKRTLGKT